MPEGPRPRGPYAKSAQQRERILDAAMAVFARSGDRGSSLREIAERVGMSQAGVLHHFGTKRDLLLAVLHRYDEEERSAGQPHTVAGSATRAREVLSRAVDNPGLFRLLITLSAEATDPEHPAHQFFVDRYAQIAEQFTEPLHRAQAEGRVRAPEPPADGTPAAGPGDVEPEALAHLVMAAMDGLQLQKLLNDRVDVLRSFDLLAEALLRTYYRAPDHLPDP